MGCNHDVRFFAYCKFHVFLPFPISAENLFGTLLHKLSVKRLLVFDTPIASVSDHVFYGINDTLQELHLVRSELTAFPRDALKILGMLRVLNIDGHRIENLPKGVFGGMTFDGTLEKFHLVNGLLSDMGQDIFMVGL